MTPSHKSTIREILGRDPVHPFPARMAPGIALEIIAEAKNSIKILDSMMGSGTVLAVARSRGHLALGIDIDPLAVLISKVWTTAINPEDVRKKAIEVLNRSQIIFDTLPTRSAYPINATRETKKFVSYWFDGYARRQLTSLSIAISRIRDETIRNVLWCSFSRLIISKQSGASLAMDLSHSRPHKVFKHAPTKPFAKFISEVDRIVKNCINKTSNDSGPEPDIRIGDARILPQEGASIDLVLTSPPYLNAIDYMRCSKFSLVWMGYDIMYLRQLRTESVGAESTRKETRENKDIQAVVAKMALQPKLANRQKAMLCRYIGDMLCAVKETARVLVPGGKAVYVIGENTIQGTYIRNSVALTAIAKLAGLRLSQRRTRTLPAHRRYLPPPSNGGKSVALDTRMRREVILSFIKPAA